MRDLTQAEKKIISLLETNCRMSASKISKITNLSPEGVIKIIQRLINRKIILKFNAKINYSKLGYELYSAHIKLVKSDNLAIQEIKNILKKYACCNWFNFCEGEYDLLLGFRISSSDDKIKMGQLFSDISEYVMEKEISIIFNAYELSTSFMDKPKKVFTIFDQAVKKENIDEQQLKLMKVIKENSRAKILNLAKELNMSPKTIAEKIKNFEKNNIVGYKTKLNLAALGFQPCIALIMLNNYDEKDYNKFLSYCSNKNCVNYFIKQVGMYDIELTINTEDINAFYEFVNEIKDAFKIVKKITTLISKGNY